MRKEKFIDFVQVESMSKVLPHRVIKHVGKDSFVVDSLEPDNPYYGVPASAFSISAQVANGGLIPVSSVVQGSNLDMRDSIDNTFSRLKSENDQKIIAHNNAQAQKQILDIIS